MGDSKDCTSQLPFFSLIGDDLSANPGLANFLMHLINHMDSSGMSIALAQPLEEARKMMQAHRANWLKPATFFWILQKIVLKPGADPILLKQNLSESLEQQLLVTELKRMLTLCLSKQNVCVSILNLETQHLTEFLPPHQVVLELWPELNRGCSVAKRDWGEVNFVPRFALLPFLKNIGAAPQMIMFGSLAERLAFDKQQLKEARTQEKQLSGCLGQQKAIYSQVLGRCLGLLRRMAQEFCLGAQSDLDQVLIQYMEMKTNALLLKIQVEEMKILLETYTPEIVNVHQMIRDELQESLSKEEINVATFRSVLSKYEVLGPEFEKLVEEYTKLHEIIQNHRWMLAEMNKH
ncbi:HAUS augmin-like complex subunit 4 [Pseudonaja textilis]|uniref:HAUS augmin-like complex subunit 4 n=1 Tax=Pseudonaja textilis TaxID=8673 RepID=UPI000EAA4EE0|nr:HAUS augmin-like complex subunit 4 [Pseudonaja textilis]